MGRASGHGTTNIYFVYTSTVARFDTEQHGISSRLHEVIQLELAQFGSVQFEFTPGTHSTRLDQCVWSYAHLLSRDIVTETAMDAGVRIVWSAITKSSVRTAQARKAIRKGYRNHGKG